MTTFRLLAGGLAAAALLAIALLAAPAAARAARVELAAADRERVPSGILLDLSPDLVGTERFDGRQAAEPARPAVLRQLLFQLERATVDGASRVTADELRLRAQDARRRAVVPLALLDMDVHAVAAGALAAGRVAVDGGRLRLLAPAALERRRLFAAAALVERTLRGSAVVFELPAGELWITNRAEAPARLEWDFDDGAGFAERVPGERVAVAYASPGEKTIRLRASWAGGERRLATLRFEVARLTTPEPSFVWDLTSSYAWEGASASGNAYVLLAPEHAGLTNPVVVCEGFDMDNEMYWEELYELTNQQQLVETLRQQGFDAVVLNFSESTDAIQRNALLLATLLEQVDAAVPAGTRYPLIGASMGGLVSRYALAWLEQQGLDPRVRTFISFDSPQAGANIPLGLQHWLAFFADESEEAAHYLSRLRTPAARQMLLLLAADPPAAVPGPDPLRQAFQDDLAALGDWPASPRLVAVANGSGSGLDQGFAAGQQVISWVYRNWLVDIDGNCWALPDHATQTVFHGRIDQIWPFPDREQTVVVGGTSPWDNAPGGWRATMRQLADSAVPYGDVIALQSAGYHDSDTFRRNLDGWLSKYRRPGTRETYEANVRQFFAWARKAPGDLTEADFVGYRDRLAEQGRAPSTVWLRFVALKGFLTYAADRSRNLRNPLDIRRLNLPRTRRDAGYQNVLTPKEAAALKRAPDRRTLIGIRDYAILMLMLVYGPRAGEVCKLRWSDADPERVDGQQKIWIRDRKGKGVDTAIILNGELLKAWDAWIVKSGLTFEPSSPVFAGFRWDRRAGCLEIDRKRWRAGKRLTVSTIENIVAKHIEGAGIDAGRRALSPHALRHTAFTELAAAGTPLPTIKYIAGHQSVETTAIYTHHRQSFEDNVAMHSRFNR